MAGSAEVSKQTMALALQWLRDEVSTSYVQKKLGAKQVSQAIYKMAVALRAARRKGLLK